MNRHGNQDSSQQAMGPRMLYRFVRGTVQFVKFNVRGSTKLVVGVLNARGIHGRQCSTNTGIKVAQRPLVVVGLHTPRARLQHPSHTEYGNPLCKNYSADPPRVVVTPFPQVHAISLTSTYPVHSVVQKVLGFRRLYTNSTRKIPNKNTLCYQNMKKTTYYNWNPLHILGQMEPSMIS